MTHSRWYIIVDEERRGPFRKKEIRDFLREGLVDPFAKIQGENSAVQVAIIDADFLYRQIGFPHDQYLFFSIGIGCDINTG